MAPQKGSRATAQETVLEDTHTITKQKLAVQSQFAARGRRNGTNNTNNVSLVNANGSGLKELAAASAVAQNYVEAVAFNGIDWQKEDRVLLHQYRSAYRLSVPSAFQNPMAQSILSSGIGPLSPTMIHARKMRRIRREDLANIVRRNFKEAPVVENECLVDLLYRVKTKDKAFRLKFPAKNPR